MNTTAQPFEVGQSVTCPRAARLGLKQPSTVVGIYWRPAFPGIYPAAWIVSIPGYSGLAADFRSIAN